MGETVGLTDIFSTRNKRA